MLQGVKILNVVPITIAEFGWSIPGFVLAALALSLTLGWIIYLAHEKEIPDWYWVITIGAIILLIVVSILLFGSANSYDVYRYEVSIDDTVSVNDFCEQYNIIEQRGEIYVIEEKEPSTREMN